MIPARRDPTGLGRSDGLRTARLPALLDRGRIDVDVLLAAELAELVHDLVGDRAQDEPVALEALEPREVERLADDDADPAHLRDPRADGHDLLGVDHRDGHHGHVTLEDHARDAGAAAVHLAVGAAGALWVDAEHVALRRGTAGRC